MNRTILAILIAMSTAAACTTVQQPPQPLLRTELTVLRHSTASDVAYIGEEEGSYIWLAQEVSPFGINHQAPKNRCERLSVYFKTDSAHLAATKLVPAACRQPITLPDNHPFQRSTP